MPRVQFAGPSAEDDTARAAHSGRLLNLYREQVQADGDTRFILRTAPGRELVADLGGSFLRNMVWVNGQVYVARAGNLELVASSGLTSSLGTIDDDEQTDMAGNFTDVTVTANGKYYVWNGTDITQYTPNAFSEVGSVETVGEYTLLTQKGGNLIQWSALSNPASLPNDNFGSTQVQGDNNIRGIEIGGQYWVFKERSIEIWYPTNLANDEAFQRAPGGVVSIGLQSFNLACKGRDTAFFVGSDGVAYITTGGAPTPVSSRAVETAIETKTPTHCFYYEQYGHKFFCLRFSDRAAWVLDVATMEWAERAQGRNFEAWDAIAAAYTGSDFWVGSVPGTVAKLSSIKTDLGATFYRRAVSPILRIGNDPFRVKELEFFGAYGYAPPPESELQVEDVSNNDVEDVNSNLIVELSGATSHIMVSTSRDGGATYDNERFLEIGNEGDFNNRTALRALGQYVRMNVRVDITHPHDVPVFADAWVDVS